ncbi:MAG: hypothetical protein AAF574_12620 [Pseudomonadota bacterium]
MSALHHTCMTKGTLAEGDQLRYSANWVTARRASLRIWSDRLECGDWVIPYVSIQEAVLVSLWQGIFPCYVLQVRTAEHTYSFGLNRGRFWKGDLPFEVRREKGKLGYSKFSIASRVFGLLGAVTWAWWTFGR